MYGFKSLISFAIGFAVVPWLELDRLIAVFCILAALVLVLDASIIIYHLHLWQAIKKTRCSPQNLSFLGIAVDLMAMKGRGTELA